MVGPRTPEVRRAGRIVALALPVALAGWAMLAPAPEAGGAAVGRTLLNLDAKLVSSSLLLSAVMLITVLLLTFVHSSVLRNVPESVLTLYAGMLVGAVFELASGRNFKNQHDPGAEEDQWVELFALQSDTFFLVFLPPIIFEASWTLKKRKLFHNFGSVTVLAVFGTLMCAGMISAGIYFLGQTGFTYPLNLGESIVFGSLISAVDPVATLAIFQELGPRCDQTLFSLVFGESLLNDAVSIVLFRTFNRLLDPEGKLAMSDIPGAFGTAAYSFMVATVLGTVVALVATLIFKYTKHKVPRVEITTVLIFGFGGYFACEALELSGIVGILFYGIVLSHYGRYNMSPQAQAGTEFVLGTLAFASDTLVFAFLGLATTAYAQNFRWVLVVMANVLCVVSRALMIVPLCAMLNCFRKPARKITAKMQVMMWFSGLRGAIAFALALYIPEEEDNNADIIFSTTLSVIIFTTTVMGCGTAPLLRALKMPSVEPETPALVIRRTKWNKFDWKYMFPLFLSPEAIENKRMMRRERIALERQRSPNSYGDLVGLGGLGTPSTTTSLSRSGALSEGAGLYPALGTVDSPLLAPQQPTGSYDSMGSYTSTN